MTAESLSKRFYDGLCDPQIGFDLQLLRQTGWKILPLCNGDEPRWWHRNIPGTYITPVAAKIQRGEKEYLNHCPLPGKEALVPV